MIRWLSCLGGALKNAEKHSMTSGSGKVTGKVEGPRSARNMFWNSDRLAGVSWVTLSRVMKRLVPFNAGQDISKHRGATR